MQQMKFGATTSNVRREDDDAVSHHSKFSSASGVRHIAKLKTPIAQRNDSVGSVSQNDGYDDGNS